MCLRLKREERNGCISSVNQWLSGARSMNVKLPAGVETVQTDCGARQPAYPADSRTVVADDVSTAEKLLKRLMTYSPGHEGGTNSVGMSFIRVPTGNFQMGSTSQERYRDSDESLHRVTISRAFLIASTEVTQGQWATVMGRDPSKAQYRTANLRGSSYPVQQITWIEAVKFANALSRREGLQPAYTGSGSSVRWNQSANGYRLLTEAEWEYAARAGEHRLYAGAEQSGNLCGVANVADRSGSQVMKVSGVRCDDGFSATAPVGSFAPNAWNIYDMTGNVAEWCWDWYGTYSRYGSDPSGPSSGTYRTYRGGSWANTSRASRIAYRNRNKVDTRFDGLGFRMARNSN
jgi:formylglycine-generating enzyme required for sulfatase activity